MALQCNPSSLWMCRCVGLFPLGVKRRFVVLSWKSILAAINAYYVPAPTETHTGMNISKKKRKKTSRMNPFLSAVCRKGRRDGYSLNGRKERKKKGQRCLIIAASLPLAMVSSNCSPIKAMSNSRQTKAVSVLAVLKFHAPPCSFLGSSHRGLTPL